MSKLRKSILSMAIVMVCLILIASVAWAYTPSVPTTIADRNRIAKNWSFLAQGYKEYNCLAWALGNTTTWIWPWNNNYPSLSQVNSFMSNRGYTSVNSNISCAIYAYGTTSAIAHFARGRGNGPLAIPIDAKWGQCELFTHTSTNPYYTIAEGGLYGKLVRGYRSN